MGSEWKFEEYGLKVVLEQDSHGLDVNGRDLRIELEDASLYEPPCVSADVPLDKLCELLARHPSGLAAMAGALRAAGYAVAEPGAESVSVLERDGEPSHMIGAELLSLPRGYAVVRYVRAPEETSR